MGVLSGPASRLTGLPELSGRPVAHSTCGSVRAVSRATASRRPGRAHALAAELGGNAVGIGADVSTPHGAKACVDAAVAAFGHLDAFHANAGVEGRAHFVADFDLAVCDHVFNVNVRGAFLCAHAALSQFSAQDGVGTLLFTTSLGSLMGAPALSIYTASKHAVHGLVRSLAREVPPGIRVNAIAPGIVDTRMMRSLEASMGAANGLDAAAMKSGTEQSIPMRRYAQPEEIAATAAWILSDEVPYLHGETITVGGGLTP